MSPYAVFERYNRQMPIISMDAFHMPSSTNKAQVKSQIEKVFNNCDITFKQSNTNKIGSQGVFMAWKYFPLCRHASTGLISLYIRISSKLN
jgi:hypothetical protein